MRIINIAIFIVISIMLGTGEEAHHPEQEQGQADKVLKAHCEQLQLVNEIKEIEREMESLGNTFTFEHSSTLETRDKLGKIQVHCNHLNDMNQTTNLDGYAYYIMNFFLMKEKIKNVKQVLLSEGVVTEEGGNTRSLTAAEGRWCII